MSARARKPGASSLSRNNQGKAVPGKLVLVGGREMQPSDLRPKQRESISLNVRLSDEMLPILQYLRNNVGDSTSGTVKDALRLLALAIMEEKAGAPFIAKIDGENVRVLEYLNIDV